MEVSRDRSVARWVAAGVIDAEAGERILAFERDRTHASSRRGPVLLALAFGGILVAAGLLLFVSANWDEMSPTARFVLVLSVLGAFHVGGAATSGRFEALATTLHGIGTAALGAGIYLSGQIFNLNEHWPSGIMLWAAGAWIGWALRRDWPQLALALVLSPAWLSAEWSEYGRWSDLPVGEVGWFLLALAWLTLNRDRLERATERTIAWLGALAFLPAAIALTISAAARIGHQRFWGPLPVTPVPLAVQALAWLVAIALPLAVAWALRRRGALFNLVATGWVVILANLGSIVGDRIWIYPWLGIGCVGLTAWGLRESRTSLVNFATTGFALTVLGFYFDTVMPKMDKSVSLVGLGILFLVGGYLLERVRRKMVDHVRGGEL